MFCTGTFERSLDEKQRLLIPKTVKKAIADSGCLFLTPGFDECLELHSQQSIEQRAIEAEKSQSTSRNRKSFARLFFAQAEKCELDSQSRIRIPQRLLEWAKLENRLVLLGVGPHWEIWDEEIWRRYADQHRPLFDEIASALLDGSDSSPEPVATNLELEQPNQPR